MGVLDDVHDDVISGKSCLVFLFFLISDCFFSFGLLGEIQGR